MAEETTDPQGDTYCPTCGCNESHNQPHNQELHDAYGG